MEKESEKESFRTIQIKGSVAQKFSKYCQEIGKSQSVTLLLMLDFFYSNNISPTENLGPSMQTLESSIKKRINAVIAIIRDIERNQTIPIKGMLEALFAELPEQSTKKAVNSFQEALGNLNAGSSSITSPPPETNHEDIRKLLRKAEIVQPSFGKAYCKLNLSPEEMENLKSKYNVYCD